MTRSSRTVLFAGASIVDAGRRTDPSGGLGAGFVRRVAEMLVAHDVEATVINAGVSGDRTGDLLARLGTDVVERRPDVLTMLVGSNDMWRRFDADSPTSPEQFEANWVMMLDRVRSELDLEQLVIMEPFLVPVTEEQESWHELDLDAKLVALREVAERYGAIHVPLDRLFAERAAAEGALSVVVDGVHPSARGNELIAQAWWAAAMPGQP